MTFTYMSTTENGYIIQLNQDKFSNLYRVEALEKRGENYYTVKSNTYTDRKKATARYKRIVRMATDGTLNG